METNDSGDVVIDGRTYGYAAAKLIHDLAAKYGDDVQQIAKMFDEYEEHKEYERQLAYEEYKDSLRGLNTSSIPL